MIQQFDTHDFLGVPEFTGEKNIILTGFEWSTEVVLMYKMYVDSYGPLISPAESLFERPNRSSKGEVWSLKFKIFSPTL